MKVKIGDKIFNTEEEPIMIIFNDDEQRIETIRNLTNMDLKPNSPRKYCMFPDHYDKDIIKKFMIIKK